MIIKYTKHLGREPDEFEAWELNEQDEPAYSDTLHENVHYALYGVAVDLEADTETGQVKVVRFRNGGDTYIPVSKEEKK